MLPTRDLVMCMFRDLVEAVSATALMCEIGAGLKHNVSDDDQQMHADSDYAYRDTRPDNADPIGRKENQRSSKIQHFAWRGPQNVLLNERDVTNQSRFYNI